MEIVFLVEEDPEGGFLARALGESIFTDADTLDDLRANIREAVKCHFPDEHLHPQPKDRARAVPNNPQPREQAPIND